VAKRSIGTSIDKITAEDIATAFHEAGHAVACVALGGRVHMAVLGDNPRTEYDVLPERDWASIVYAGPWAEARHIRGRHPGPHDMHRVLAGTSDEIALRAAGGSAAGHGIASLLEHCWPAVEQLATRLLVAGRADHAEVCIALGLNDDGGPGSFELACIRSGLRAVS
jgi:hypothetical protein